MAHSEHTFNQSRCQVGHVVPHAGQILRIRKIVVESLHPFQPFGVILLPDVGCHKELLVPVPVDPGKAGQPGGVPVIIVHLETVLFADLIQFLDALLVFFQASRIDVDNGVDGLLSGEDKSHHRELQLTDQGFLKSRLHSVRLHQGISEICNIGVLHALPIEGIKADPGAGLRVVIPQSVPDGVIDRYRAGLRFQPVFLELLDVVPGCHAGISYGRYHPAVFFIRLHGQGYDIFRLKNRIEVSNHIPDLVPAVRFLDFLFRLQIMSVYDLDVRRYFIVPVQSTVRALCFCLRRPAPVFGHLRDGGSRDDR